MDRDDARLSAQDTPREEDPLLWLQPWLGWLDRALGEQVRRLRARYQLQPDEWHGLYVSDEQVDRALRPDGAPDPELHRQREGLLTGAYDLGSPLRDLARRLGLTEVDLVAVVLCLAPEVELRYQAMYAYLNDDASRRLPSVDLCERVAGAPLDPASTAVADGLVEVVRVTGAPLWRSAGLLLAEPVRRFLLGSDPAPPVPRPGTGPVRGRLARVTVLEAWSPDEADEAALALACAAQRRVVRTDGAEPDVDRRLRHALLRARLHDATLHLSGADLGLDGDTGPDQLLRWRRLLEAPVPLIISTRPGARLPYDPVDAERIVVAGPGTAERVELWSSSLQALGLRAEPDDVAAVAALFALGPAQVRAAAQAVARSAGTGFPVLAEAARARSASALGQVAERVRSDVGWDDLVLPATSTRRLRQLSSAVRFRREVYEQWDFGRLAGGGASVRAMFSGPSGTGKTMAAAVVARELGLDLYRVDLSAVVSKYIGETEKNLERVLSAAERSDAVLLFDEADALFGRRSEVKDSHDRYANIEVSFLLQRLETFDGVLVLATNLAGHLDEAFARRIPFQIAFPAPDEMARRELWRRALPPTAPVAADVDPGLLGRIPLTGGGIRSAALLAAFLAAHEGAPIAMSHLVRAVARQRQQEGKGTSAGEFGAYLRQARQEGV